MTYEIKGKCLVTGASSGIGKAYAELLARAGHELVLVARRQAVLEDLANQFAAKTGKQPEVIVADLSDRSDVARLETRLAQSDIGMLVNNAGIGGMSDFVKSDIAEIENMIAVNVTALTRLSHAAASAMKAAGRGTIVNVASALSFNVIAGASVYAGSKAYVSHFTRALALEMEGSGIRFQILVPGLTRTNLGGAQDTGLFDTFPAEKVQSPEAVAAASLAGLDLDELVCLPRQEDYSRWEQARDAMNSIGIDPEHNRVASRYNYRED